MRGVGVSRTRLSRLSETQSKGEATFEVYGYLDGYLWRALERILGGIAEEICTLLKTDYIHPVARAGKGWHKYPVDALNRFGVCRRRRRQVVSASTVAEGSAELSP